MSKLKPRSERYAIPPNWQLVACLGWVLASVFISSVAYGQALNTATIRGQVLDQSRAAITNAQVVVTNNQTGVHRETTTDEKGNFTCASLPLTGGYTVLVSQSGFAAEEVTDVTLQAGEAATFEITLNPQGENSVVTVYGTTEGVRSDSPQLSNRLDLQKIDNTPILGRKVTSLVLLDSAIRPARGTGDLFLNNTLFVANGSGRRQTGFIVDGSTGDDAWGRQSIFTNIPFSAIQEFTILTNGFSAEFGRTTGGVVNLVTQSGTNTFHGDLLGLFRPGGIQARQPLATRQTEDELAQVSGVFSGPIIENRTHFLVSAEYSHQDRDAVITSPLAPGLFTGTYKQGLFLARLDHQLNNRNALEFKLNFDRFSDTNPSDAVGGVALPSSARIFRRRAYEAQLSETAIVSDRIVNEARLQFQLGSPITQFEPVMPSTQYLRPGISTEGESRSAKLQNRQFQFADTLSIVAGKHIVKVGGDVVYTSSGGFGQEFGGGFVLGQITLNPGVLTPIGQLQARDVQRFSQSFGNADYTVRQTLSSVFIQDDIKLRSDLTLNLGLRYENQSLTDDHNNIAPRIGFAYNIGGDTKTVLRGSYGIYYSQLRANIVAGFKISGPTGVFTFSAAPGQLGFPDNLLPLSGFPAGAVLPPRDIQVRPGDGEFLSQFFDVSKLRGYPDALLNPYTQLWSLGVERELGQKWFLRVDYVGQHTIGIDRPVDLNSPAAFVRTRPGQVRSAAEADATRPIKPVPNGYRRILATINEGASNYNALQINLNKRFSQNFSVLASYTYSNSINTVEPDAPGQDPTDATMLGKPERARSVLNQTNRAVISGWYQLPLRFTVGGVASLASGRPYNITTGLDNNGDGSTADRPVVNGFILGRNAGKGTPVYDVGMFVEHTFKLPAERVKLSLRAEAFNLFNHNNIVGRNGVFGNDPTGKPLATLGKPLGGISNVDPGRQFQFVAKVRF